MYPVAVAKVVAALGGATALGATPVTLDELSAAVARGLPRAVVSAVAHAAADSQDGLRRRVAAAMVSPATYKRSEHLSPAASERAERLGRITALAAEALGDAGAARAWLADPHPMLGDEPPILVAATDLGARQVERLLLNIAHDLPA